MGSSPADMGKPPRNTNGGSIGPARTLPGTTDDLGGTIPKPASVSSYAKGVVDGRKDSTMGADWGK